VDGRTRPCLELLSTGSNAHAATSSSRRSPPVVGPQMTVVRGLPVTVKVNRHSKSVT